ncbi:hypothetical protein QTO01_11260 [Vibrio mytili]|uniref:hypothetical protein n=1 Tax=Vibrio mytili TaxID=50718 RepID=UPI002F3EF483
MKYRVLLTCFKHSDITLKYIRFDKDSIVEGKDGEWLFKNGYAVPLNDDSKLETKVVVPDVDPPAKPKRKRPVKKETKEG